MKIQNKWIICLSITMLMGLANLTVLNGMEKQRAGVFEDIGSLPQELQASILQEAGIGVIFRSLPQELQKHILLYHGTIEFLAHEPIRLKDEYGGHFDVVWSVAISGDKVATASWSTVSVWDIKTGQKLLEKYAGPVASSVALNGNIMAAGTTDGLVQIWDVRDIEDKPLREFKGHTKRVWAVAIYGDNLISASQDKTAKIWNIKTGKIIHTLQHTDPVSSIAISGDILFTGSADNTIRMWNIKTGKLLHTLKGHTDTVYSIAVSGNKLVSGSWDKTIKIWDINTRKLLHTLNMNTEVRGVAISGNKLAVGLNDYTAKIYDLNTYQLLQTLKGHKSSITAIAIDDDTVVTGSADKNAKIWSLRDPFKGTIEDNPLLWIIQETTIPQLDLIKRACEATEKQQNFVIDFPSEDAKIILSFPVHVRKYLLARLNIKRYEK